MTVCGQVVQSSNASIHTCNTRMKETHQPQSACASSKSDDRTLNVLHTYTLCESVHWCSAPSCIQDKTRSTADEGQNLLSFHKCRGETPDICLFNKQIRYTRQAIDCVINASPSKILSHVSPAIGNSQILLRHYIVER